MIFVFHYYYKLVYNTIKPIAERKTISCRAVTVEWRAEFVEKKKSIAAVNSFEKPKQNECVSDRFDIYIKSKIIRFNQNSISEKNIVKELEGNEQKKKQQQKNHIRKVFAACKTFLSSFCSYIFVGFCVTSSCHYMWKKKK